jgi:hypothetical protein
MPALLQNPFKTNPLLYAEKPVLVVVPAALPEREMRKNLLTPTSSGIASQIAAALSATVQPGAPVPTRKVMDERVQFRDAPPGAARPTARTSMGSEAHDHDDL